MTSWSQYVGLKKKIIENMGLKNKIQIYDFYGKKITLCIKLRVRRCARSVWNDNKNIGFVNVLVLKKYQKHNKRYFNRSGE